jgi:hypothetical protein
MFDGSVTFDRTQGTIGARCDLEANNFLALNLANDIVTNKNLLNRLAKHMVILLNKKMSGSPEYMEKLTFSSQPECCRP